MAFDLNKLSQMAKSRPDEAKQKATDRKKNREWLRISQDIALALHYYLRTMKITQKELADRMQVTHHSFIFLPSTKQSVVFHSRQNISTGYAPITGGVA